MLYYFYMKKNCGGHANQNSKNTIKVSQRNHGRGVITIWPTVACPFDHN
jgi:hypothetical protein